MEDAKICAVLARHPMLMSTALLNERWYCSSLCSEPLRSMPYVRCCSSSAVDMSLVLNYGQTSFVGIKMALTGIGAWLLVAHHYFPMAYRGLLGLAGGYIGLLFLHAVLLLS
jgi:hypothetical protein